MNEKLEKKEIAKQYVKASVHYGHSPKEWNPKMAPYILYAKYGYHIFDLVKTSKLLRLAGNVLQKKAENLPAVKELKSKLKDQIKSNN